tara:strand:+ start:124 stop:1053 length:930 start_codon:yes stop_codon:yes gene_type:complete
MAVRCLSDVCVQREAAASSAAAASWQQPLAAESFQRRYGMLLAQPVDNHTQSTAWIREATKHAPGSPAHHRAYVAPPASYGEMGASMFSLLYFAGFNTASRLLDVGCGSLRLGRLAIPFLDSTNYHCIEPSLSALAAGVQHEVGHDLLRLKWPAFALNADFQPPRDRQTYGETYDYIIAQSIFSHVGEDLLRLALGRLRQHMTSRTVFLATAILPGDPSWGELAKAEEYSGWLYPACTGFDPRRLETIASEHDLAFVVLPWPHERQTWFALCVREADALCRRVADGLPRFDEKRILNVQVALTHLARGA